MNVFDVIGGEGLLAENAKIEPLVWGTHQATVVKIERVYVDVKSH